MRLLRRILDTVFFRRRHGFSRAYVRKIMEELRKPPPKYGMRLIRDVAKKRRGKMKGDKDERGTRPENIQGSED